VVPACDGLVSASEPGQVQVEGFCGGGECAGGFGEGEVVQAAVFGDGEFGVADLVGAGSLAGVGTGLSPRGMSLSAGLTGMECISLIWDACESDGRAGGVVAARAQVWRSWAGGVRCRHHVRHPRAQASRLINLFLDALTARP